jgi:hypothetical protein
VCVCRHVVRAVNIHICQQSIGPLFPFAEYTIINGLCTSLACYLAVAVAVTIFVFPETMNHSCLSSTSAQLGQIKALIAIQSTILESNPDDLAPDTPIRTKIMGMRRAVIMGQKACKLHLQIFLEHRLFAYSDGKVWIYQPRV